MDIGNLLIKHTKMKKSNLLLICLFMIMVSCNQNNEPSLKMVWSTEPILKTPESIIYDSNNDVIYAGNMNEGTWRKDGDGYISILSKDGKMKVEKWITDLSNPKGMGLWEGKLFVADCDEVVEINISKGEITMRYKAETARTLNDIDINSEGKVFVSDSRRGDVYYVGDTSVIFWVKIEGQGGINGLYALKDSLLVGGDRITKVDYETGNQDPYIYGTGDIDGIEWVGGNQYIVSDWNGIVRLVSPTSHPVILLNTKPDSINTADIEFIQKENILLIPTFFDNRVLAYKLNDLK